MNKLLKLKEALSAPEACQFLGLLIGENVTMEDLDTLREHGYLNPLLGYDRMLVGIEIPSSDDGNAFNDLSGKGVFADFWTETGIRVYGLAPCVHEKITEKKLWFAMVYDSEDRGYLVAELLPDSRGEWDLLAVTWDRLASLKVDAPHECRYLPSQLIEIAGLVNVPTDQLPAMPPASEIPALACTHPDGLIAIEHPESYRRYREIIDEPRPVERPQTKSAQKRVQNTLLTIIGALCHSAGIEATGRGAAARIKELTEIVGAPIDDDTIRNILKQVPEAIEARSK